MITCLAWILLITVSIILILAISALFWKPADPAVGKKKSVSTPAFSFGISEEEKEENQLKTERYMQEISIRWKDLKLMLEKIQLDHALLFHWKGLHGKKTMLFSITEENAGLALFEAVNNLNQSSLIPDMDFYIAIPLSTDPDVTSLELIKWFHDQNILLDLVFESQSGLYDMPGLNGVEAGIAIGEKPSVLYQVKGDTPDADWLASLDSQDLCEPQWNEQANWMYESLRKQLPWQVRFEIRCPFLYHKKGIYDLMTVLPDSRYWFLPKLDKRGDYLYVSANDHAILETAEKQIEKSASAHQIHLDLLRKTEKRLSGDPESENYRIISEACRNSIQIDAAIPILKETKEKEEDYAPVETIAFSPLMDGKNVTSGGSVSFYEKLLCRRI